MERTGMKMSDDGGCKLQIPDCARFRGILRCKMLKILFLLKACKIKWRGIMHEFSKFQEQA